MTRNPTDDFLRDLLGTPRRIACVGVSPNPIRPSNYVGRYLSLRGHDVVPVNPVAEGQALFGTTVVAGLPEVAPPPDMLDIFRRPEAVPAIVEEGLALFPDMLCVWLQIGIVSPEAEAMCNAAGVPIVQDRCPKIEYQRLFGELRMGGFATGIISSKL